MASCMKVHAKQMCIVEFLHAGKITPIGIHQHLSNVYGDQTDYEHNGLCISAVVILIFVISCVPDSTLQLKTHEMKSKLKIDSQWW